MKEKTEVGVAVDVDSLESLDNYFDMVMFQTLYDSKVGGEVLRLAKPAFDAKKPIEKLDVDEVLMLKLIYGGRKYSTARNYFPV